MHFNTETILQEFNSGGNIHRIVYDRENSKYTKRILILLCLLGILTNYIPLQLNIFWVSHMAILYWLVSFPFKANTTETKRWLRIIHMVLLVVGIIGPSAPAIAVIVDDIMHSNTVTTPGRLGFGLGYFPPILCVGLNPEIVFHFVILPSVFLTVIGISCLVLMIWTLHKV